MTGRQWIFTCAISLKCKQLAKRTGNTSSALNSAKSAKNDEFYTQMTDIEKERV